MVFSKKKSAGFKTIETPRWGGSMVLWKVAWLGVSLLENGKGRAGDGNPPRSDPPRLGEAGAEPGRYTQKAKTQAHAWVFAFMSGRWESNPHPQLGRLI